MSHTSSIEWTNATWNPVTGCSKVSPGCTHCYAETFAERWRGVKGHPYEHGFDLQLRPERMDQPLRWKRTRLIFVNSMSDLFHEKIPVGFIEQVFATMVLAKQHVFQALTKRAERLAMLAGGLPWPENVWMGVSVENERYVHRIDSLRSTPATVKFLSLEPLLGPLPNLNLSGISWVIVGGESGPGARPMDLDWARDLRDQCGAAGVQYFFKQIGGVHKAAAGRLLDGRTWDEMPRRRAA